MAGKQPPYPTIESGKPVTDRRSGGSNCQDASRPSGAIEMQFNLASEPKGK